MSKKIIVTSIIVLISALQLRSQKKSGFYMNWNADHTEREVIPKIPLTASEIDRMYGYYVTFDAENRLQSVKFYFEGNKSNYGNYGAHELIREYHKGYFLEKFKNTDGKLVANRYGVDNKKYILNKEGFWIEKQHFFEGNLLEKGVAYSSVTRNLKNELATEIQFSIHGDTIPDGNGFSIVGFEYDQNGLTKKRFNINQKGELKNGIQNYAIVCFQFDENGMFFNEQFLDEKERLFLHPRFDLAIINWRSFNEYGKPEFIYYIDQKGYPHRQRAYAKITYRKNMTRESLTYFDREGNLTSDKNNIAKTVYLYSKDGQFLGRINYDLSGNKIE